MNKKYFILLAACALLGAGCQTIAPPSNSVPPKPSPGPVACTMEAKQCPDGSYVGRSGPNCEFAACPTGGKGIEGSPCSGPNATSCAAGFTCTQDCGPPVARVGDPAPGYSCHVTGQRRMCPICLASNSMILTPNGSVNVRALKVGQLVFTQDAQGHKIIAPILKLVKTPVPNTHQVVHLLLTDGREVWISPNHPTADGRTLGELKAGDRFDGSTVKTAQLVPYWDDATYDLLPAGDTGTYWADGILVGSTLK